MIKLKQMKCPACTFGCGCDDDDGDAGSMNLTSLSGSSTLHSMLAVLAVRQDNECSVDGGLTEEQR